jgi:hypothetical protein
MTRGRGNTATPGAVANTAITEASPSGYANFHPITRNLLALLINGHFSTSFLRFFRLYKTNGNGGPLTTGRTATFAMQELGLGQWACQSERARSALIGTGSVSDLVGHSLAPTLSGTRRHLPGSQASRGPWRSSSAGVLPACTRASAREITGLGRVRQS